MKLNLTEKQYEQFAKEQFCKVMKEDPFVSDIEVIRTNKQKEFGDFCAVVHFTEIEEPIHFCIKVRSNGEKRYVNWFMQMIEQYKNDICYVFMAPFISEESANAMRRKKCSYMDLSGNCYILTKRIFLHVSGQANKYIAKREKKNYLSKSAGAVSTVLRTMLNEPQRLWQVVTLAEESGRAIGTVSNMKKFLLDRDWLKTEGAGFRLQNIKELLYAWAKDYHKKDARSYEYYSLQPISELEQEIMEWNCGHDNGAILGGFSAAMRYAPTVRYKKVNVYVESQFFNEFIKDLDLRSVESGGNVVITIPHDETPCMFPKKIHGSIVTSPAQTVIDLLGNVGRGEEAADAVILKEFSEDYS